MKSNTKIDKQIERKTNPILKNIVILAKKNEKWKPIAEVLASPRSNKVAINLDEIDKHAKLGDTIVVPGKVLGTGKITKKIKMVAFAISEQAAEKLKKEKCEIVTMEKEIKENPQAQGVKILR
jgi:large subunit ribosomal protein L18e